MQTLENRNEIPMNNSIKKILWTVDPFAKEKDLQRSAARAIKNLTEGFECVIEPVYFFSAYLTGEYPMEVPKDWLKDVHKKGQKELNRIVSRIGLKNLKPLHVISEPYFTMREGVARINLIAKRWKSDLIVTSTHAQKGLKRLFLGSFAETLLLHSDVPLFFVNPHWNRRVQFKHILFLTDFSDESKEAFIRVLDIAKSMKIELTLFHKLAYLWPPTVIISVGVFPMYSEVFEQELDARKEDALRWSEEAKAKGVRVNVYVDHRMNRSIADSAISFAKKKPGIIAMASKSGPTKTALLGSTTRKVVRESPFPVWVLHPKAKVQEKGESLFTLTEEDLEKDLKRIPHVKKAA